MWLCKSQDNFNYTDSPRVKISQKSFRGLRFTTHHTVDYCWSSSLRPIAGVFGNTRSFPVAAAILWNTLPMDVQSSPSLPVFRQRLKIFLFHKSFTDVVWQTDYAFVDLVMAYCYFSHVKNFLINWLIDIAKYKVLFDYWYTFKRSHL